MPENTGISGILSFSTATNWLHPLVGVACTGQTVKIVGIAQYDIYRTEPPA